MKKSKTSLNARSNDKSSRSGSRSGDQYTIVDPLRPDYSDEEPDPESDYFKNSEYRFAILN